MTETIRKTIMAIMLILITQAILYFFFAFVCWDINWIPDCNWFGRFAYGVIAFLNVISVIGYVIEEL